MRANAWKRDDGSSVPEAERPRLLALALSGYAAEGKRVLVTNEFAGMLRTTIRSECGPHSSSPSAEEEASTEERRRTEARHRASQHDAELERMNAEGADTLKRAQEAKAWLDGQDDAVQTQVLAMMAPGLKRLGIRDAAKAPMWAVGPVLATAVSAYREKHPEGASA
jgi:hypothetical protein